MSSAAPLQQPSADSRPTTQDAAADAPLRFGPRPRRHDAPPTSMAPVAGKAAPAPLTPALANGAEGRPRTYRTAGWVLLGLGIPSLAAALMVAVFPGFRPAFAPSAPAVEPAGAVAPGAGPVSAPAQAPETSTAVPAEAAHVPGGPPEAARPELAADSSILRSPGVRVHVFPREVPLPGSAAPSGTRRVAMLERERDALAAQLDRLQSRLVDQAVTAERAPTLSFAPVVAVATSAKPAAPDLSSLPSGMPARVLVRFTRGNAEAHKRAGALAAVLSAEGIEIADLRESPGILRTTLSFSYAPDEALALRIGRLAGVAVMRRPVPKDGLLPRPGTVELGVAGPATTMAPSDPQPSHQE